MSPPGKGRQLVDWDRRHNEIITMYEQRKMTLRKIGEVLGVSHVTVCAKLDEWGVPRRGGVHKRHIRVHDLTGKRYGRLVVVARDRVRYPVRWKARCDCGKVVSYTTQRLRSRRSCGCAPRGPRPSSLTQSARARRGIRRKKDKRRQHE